jgi:hypothetical protein
MIVLSIAVYNTGMRILGIDPGYERIGIAVLDPGATGKTMNILWFILCVLKLVPK